MLKLLTLFVPALFLNLGCASTNQIMTGPDGTPHHLLSCTHVRICYSRATEVCGGAYKIVNTSNNINSGLYGPTTTTLDMLIKCESTP